MNELTSATNAVEATVGEGIRMVRAAPAPLPPPGTLANWQALRYLGLYRLTLAGFFTLVAWAFTPPPPMGILDSELFRLVALFYLLAAIALQAANELRLVHFFAQIAVAVGTDIAALTLMLYASGGVTSGFGMLLVVVVAAGSLLTSGRVAVMFAAMASLAVLSEEVYLFTDSEFYSSTDYTHAGLLGIVFFATATIGYSLAERARRSEMLAAKQAVDLESLARVNDQIVERMQSGILVLDGVARVLKSNESARRLLRSGQKLEGELFADAVPELEASLSQWRSSRRNQDSPTAIAATGTEVLVSFALLGPGMETGILVFVEDAATTRQRAQQLKLASLGRLTASIAHEIRNPLGAIRHAGQLLDEAPGLESEDKRLTRIIRDNSDRVNDIIENVLGIGRRSLTVSETFVLEPWLRAFVEEFEHQHELPPGAIPIILAKPEIEIRMDQSQLRQVVTNLCENALRHSISEPAITLIAGVSAATERPYLKVEDRGPGIKAGAESNVFEPFFTTEKTGTGLGLYVASELCEANHARLRLEENSPDGCVFLIDFAHPDKQQKVST